MGNIISTHTSVLEEIAGIVYFNYYTQPVVNYVPYALPGVFDPEEWKRLWGWLWGWLIDLIKLKII